MDQVLKDVMLDLAEQDREDGLEGMAGREGEENIADIMSRVYKIRPFGEKPGNMRELDPTGRPVHVNIQMYPPQTDHTSL